MAATLTLRHEAKMLSQRTGLRWEACEAWMKHAGIRSIMDLQRRYPTASHAEAMVNAIREIEDHAFGS